MASPWDSATSYSKVVLFFNVDPARGRKRVATLLLLVPLLLLSRSGWVSYPRCKSQRIAGRDGGVLILKAAGFRCWSWWLENENGNGAERQTSSTWLRRRRLLHGTNESAKMKTKVTVSKSCRERRVLSWNRDRRSSSHGGGAGFTGGYNVAVAAAAVAAGLNDSIAVGSCKDPHSTHSTLGLILRRLQGNVRETDRTTF
jgi:hypothetical protein